MKKITDLDKIDRKILDLIQTDARMSVVELSSHVNLTKTPCLNRLRRLEKEGFISEYTARLDPVRSEQRYLVFVQVKLQATRRNCLEEFNKAVQNVPEIQGCYMMSGGYDYLLKIRTRNMDTYRALLGDVISVLPHVDQTSTFPVMENVKDTTRIPVMLA